MYKVKETHLACSVFLFLSGCQGVDYFHFPWSVISMPCRSWKKFKLCTKVYFPFVENWLMGPKWHNNENEHFILIYLFNDLWLCWIAFKAYNHLQGMFSLSISKKTKTVCFTRPVRINCSCYIIHWRMEMTLFSQNFCHWLHQKL